MDLRLRYETARLMQQEFYDFTEFARAGMKFLGFDITPMQLDIAEFMDTGPDLLMVQAQRGEAKSTIAALKAVHALILDPRSRILIVSAADDKASEIATLIYRIINTWDILAYLRPDTSAKDRDSATKFDVHYALKGIDQSPSVTTVGIFANLPGRRADLIIADDIESPKNSGSPREREKLIAATREFSAICTHGRIMYLGTPQSKDSIYNTLPARGYTVRIWTGRFPNAESLPRYGNMLAKFITDRLERDPSLGTGGGLDGTLGKPADPYRFNEEDLLAKELEWGVEGFALQYLLDTSLADMANQQLRLEDLIVADFDQNTVPEVIHWRSNPDNKVELPDTFPLPRVSMYHGVVTRNTEWVALPTALRQMYIDPAGEPLPALNSLNSVNP